MDIFIRPATPEDLPAIVAIYNQAIESREATGHMDVFRPEERRAWFEQFDDAFPLFVAESQGRVIGYGSLSPYRPGRRAMRHTVEVSFFVDYAWHQRGVGRKLLQYARQEAKRLHKGHILAFLLDINGASVHLLESEGFECWGHLPGIIDLDGRRCGQYVYGLAVFP